MERIRWRDPIEAYHEDGTVVPAKFYCWCNGDVAAVSFDHFGQANRHTESLPYGYVGAGWRIRNVEVE